MFQTLDEAVSFIRHKSVAMVDLKFCDLWGRWRHVTLPAGRFNPSLMESGVGFDGSSLGLSAVKSGDLVLVPELGTAFLDPFWEAPTISFLCATLEADTRQPFPHDPRTLAARAEEFLRTSGVGEASLWGPEFEFYLFDGVSYENGMNVAAYRVESREADWKSHELGGGYTIPRHGGYHAIPPQDHLFNARTKISPAPRGDGGAGQVPPPRGGRPRPVRDRDADAAHGPGGRRHPPRQVRGPHDRAARWG